MLPGRALVIGGSVGGLFAAGLLRQAGWDVAVFERTAGDLASRGAAIGLTRELAAVMSRLGLSKHAQNSANVTSYILLDRSGAVDHEIHRQAGTGAWAYIYRPLRDAFPDGSYHAGLALSAVEQNADSVTAIFADGSRATGDLLIGADGIYSTVRQQFLPQATPEYAGYVAWRGVLDESQLPQQHRELLLDHLVFAVPPGELLLTIPIPPDETTGTQSRRCCFIWYRPADAERELPELCTDASGRRHGITIPPPLVRPEVIRNLKQRAQELLPPVIAELVARVERPLFQAIFDLQSPQLAFGRVALLGDAGFVARPHVVAGVSKAALDAQCLTDALTLEVGLAPALARYDRARRDFGDKIIAHARYLGAYLGAHTRGQVGVDHPSDRRPDILMRDYGAAHMLRR